MGSDRRRIDKGVGSGYPIRTGLAWARRSLLLQSAPLRSIFVANRWLCDPIDIQLPSDLIRHASPIYPIGAPRSEQGTLPDPNRGFALIRSEQLLLSNLDCRVSFRSEPESYNLKYFSMVGFLTLCCLVHKVG